MPNEAQTPASCQTAVSGSYLLGRINELKYTEIEFEEQITDVELVIDTTPRVYVKWNNTEEGRDKKDCYERVVIGGSVIYINTYNRKSSIICGHPFWDKLEKMYNGMLSKQT